MTRNRLRRVLAAVSLTTLLATGLASPADAAQLGVSQGRPGSISTSGALITARDHRVVYSYSPTYTFADLPMFETAGFVAGTSPVNGRTQSIRAVYYLQRYVNGAWSNVSTAGPYSGNATGAGTLRFPATNWSNPPAYQRSFGYRVIYVVGWYDPASNALLASTVVVPSTQSDNRCATIYRRCTPYWDGLVM